MCPTALPECSNDYAIDFHAPFDFEISRSALLVIDLQYASASRYHGLGRLLAERGEANRGAWRFDRIEQQVVPNVRRLLDRYRSVGSPVVYVTLGSRTGSFDDVAPFLRPLTVATNNRVGSPNHEILELVAPSPGDPVVVKTTAGGFLGSDLYDVLQRLGVDQVVLTGVSTNSCVESTGREAADLGYQCALVDDACAAASAQLHRASAISFGRLFGRVLMTDTLLSQW